MKKKPDNITKIKKDKILTLADSVAYDRQNEMPEKISGSWEIAFVQ